MGTMNVDGVAWATYAPETAPDYWHVDHFNRNARLNDWLFGNSSNGIDFDDNALRGTAGVQSDMRRDVYLDPIHQPTLSVDDEFIMGCRVKVPNPFDDVHGLWRSAGVTLGPKANWHQYQPQAVAYVGGWESILGSEVSFVVQGRLHEFVDPADYFDLFWSVATRVRYLGDNRWVLLNRWEEALNPVTALDSGAPSDPEIEIHVEHFRPGVYFEHHLGSVSAWVKNFWFVKIN